MALSSTARTLLLAILLIGLAGTAAELLLLAHHEDWEQWIPLVLLVGTLAMFAVYGLTRSLRILGALCWARLERYVTLEGE